MYPRLPLMPVSSKACCQTKGAKEYLGSTSMGSAALPLVPVRSYLLCQNTNLMEEIASTSVDPTPALEPIRTRFRAHNERTVVMEDTGDHNLLREPTYEFSVYTLQRAFIAWTALDRQYDFRAVCKYYHFLEQHEATLPKPNQEHSRDLEYSHIYSCGMAADFLHHYFPREIDPVRVKLVTIPPQPATADDPTLPASLLITSYLRETGRDISEMLYAYKTHAQQEGIPATLFNLVQYVRCLTVHHRRNNKATDNHQSIDEILKGPFRAWTGRPVPPMAAMYMRIKAMNEDFIRRHRHSMTKLPRILEPDIFNDASTSADRQVDDETAGGHSSDGQTLALRRV